MNLGNDFVLSDDGDLMLNATGDYMITTDIEQANPNNPYDGYESILITLARIVYYCSGEYSVVDILFGAGGQDLISSNIDKTFNEFADRCRERILEDDRFKSVEEVSYSKIANGVYKILVRVLVVGSSASTSYEINIG